jgi:hypothetical protein
MLADLALFRVVTTCANQRIELGIGDAHARMPGFHTQADVAATPYACLFDTATTLIRPAKSSTPA